MSRNIKSPTAQSFERLEWDGRDFKKFDTGGLYLHVKKNGSYWRMKYTFNKKEKLLSFGSYKEFTLADAREMRNEARKLIRQGIDPSIHKKIATSAKLQAYENTFELIAREWWTLEHCKDVSEDHANKNLRRLEIHIFPFIGNLPISEIEPVILLRCLQRIVDLGYVETAHRVKSICGSIFRYSIVYKGTNTDITYFLKGLLPTPETKHHAAITDPDKFSNLLKLIDNYVGEPTTRAALKLSPLVFIRPGELRKAKWADINFETKIWEFKRSKITKRDRKNTSDNNLFHIVPLSNQAISILKEIHPLTSKSMYVFPSLGSTSKPMSNNTVRAALLNLGISNDEMTGHGFRASARTILEEVLNYDAKYIEMQLAHVVKDHNGRAYNRTEFIKQRTKMMQRWANYLDNLKSK